MLNSFFMGICRRQFVRRLAGGMAAAVVGRSVVRPKLLVLVVLEQMRQDYLDRIFTKLKVHTRTEAALLYTRASEKMPSWE